MRHIVAIALAAALLGGQAAAAPPAIEGPPQARPNEPIRLAITGIDGPDLTKATLADLATWLQALTITANAPQAAAAPTLEIEISLTLGGTIRPRVTFTATTPGDYVVIVADSRRSGPDAIGHRRIVVANPGPPPPPPEPPTPPQPPPQPPPITAAGFRCLLIYEQAADMPPEQRYLLTNAQLRAWLNEHAVMENNRPAWRFYDQNTDLTNEAQTWRTAMALPRQSLPWLILSNGTTGYAGPLPPNAAAMLELCQRYATPKP